jgi:hypothetical protein
MYVGPYEEVEVPRMGKFKRGESVEVSDEDAAKFDYGFGTWAYVTEHYEAPVEVVDAEQEGAISADNKEVD